MPLFTINKKQTNNSSIESNKPDDTIRENYKPLNINIPVIVEKPKIEEKIVEYDYALLGCNKLKFYFIYYSKERKPFNHTTYSYLPDNDKFENRVLCQVYALKVLIEQLRRENKKSIIIYSDIKDIDLIKEWAAIKDTGSMFRYKSKEVLTLLEEYPLKITFKNIEDYKQYKEVVDNENRLPGD